MDAPPKVGLAVFMSAAAGCLGFALVLLAFTVIDILVTVTGLQREWWPVLVWAAVALWICAVVAMRLVVWSPHFWLLWPLVAWWPWVLVIGWIDAQASADRSGMVQLLAGVLGIVGLAIAIGAVTGRLYLLRRRSLSASPSS